MLIRLSIGAGIDLAIAATLTVGLQAEMWTFPYVEKPVLLAALGLLTTVPLARGGGYRSPCLRPPP